MVPLKGRSSWRSSNFTFNMITFWIGVFRNFFKKFSFFNKIWIIHKVCSVLVDFGHLWPLKFPKWLQILPCCLLQLLLHHLVWLLTKFHQNISSSWWENSQKPFKKTIKIDLFRVKFSPWSRKLGKNLMIHRGKEIYHRFRISNQIFDSIYGSQDIEQSLETTIAVFDQNWHFMDEYLENGAKSWHAVFAGCSILISSTFWSILAKIVRAVLEKKSKNRHFDHIFVLYGWTRFFSDKPPCEFLALIVRNFHAKNQENR